MHARQDTRRGFRSLRRPAGGRSGPLPRTPVGSPHSRGTPDTSPPAATLPQLATTPPRETDTAPATNAADVTRTWQATAVLDETRRSTETDAQVIAITLPSGREDGPECPRGPLFRAPSSIMTRLSVQLTSPRASMQPAISPRLTMRDPAQHGGTRRERPRVRQEASSNIARPSVPPCA